MIIYEGGKQRKKNLMPGKIIPASFDKLFKAVWQDPRNKNLLSYVLSKLLLLLLLNENAISQNLVFKNTELPKEKYEDKGLITDLIMAFFKLYR